MTVHRLPTGTDGLPEASRPRLVGRADGDGEELGLYGNILVTSNEAGYWPPVNRELLLTLDDILIQDGKIAAFSEAETTHVAMGRFGNVMLVSGEADPAFEARRGEVVRFYFTNTANTRVFNVTLPGVLMKLVGADAGHYEHEQFVDEVLLAPSERVVVDVLFPDRGEPRSSTELPSAPIASLRSPSSTGSRGSHSRTSSRARAPTGTWSSNENASRPTSKRRPTRRSPSSPR